MVLQPGLVPLHMVSQRRQARRASECRHRRRIDERCGSCLWREVCFYGALVGLAGGLMALVLWLAV